MWNPFRKALATVRLWKMRARNFWTTDVPDCFALLDLFSIIAGVRLYAQNGCQRFVWMVYLGVGYFQMLISLLSCVSTLINREDVVMTMWCVIMVVSEMLCLVKQNHLVRHGKEVKEMRKFLDTECYDSGDTEFDEAVRNRFKGKSRGLIVVVGSLIVFQQMLCWIPNPQQNRMLYIPPWIGDYFGQGFAKFLQVIYISVFDLFWVSKLFCCTIVSTVFLMGVQAEQEILVHHFGRFEGDLEELRESYHDSEQCKEQYWNRLRSLIKSAMDHQVLILSQLRSLKSLIETLFFYIYYFALMSVGSTFFIILSEPVSFMHFVICGNVSILAFECYVLSYLVESIKDVFAQISGHTFRLCAQLPYSADRCHDYFHMRTTLAVIGHCSRHVVHFGCPGIADISVDVFTELVNTSYSVFTFLLKMI